MRATLILQTGGVDQVVELGDRTLIGRHPTNDVQILDANVSARHCLVERGKDGYFVRDLNSTNGTHVNGARNDGNAERLHHEDLIVVGETTMRFEHEPSGVLPMPVEEELQRLRDEFRRRLGKEPVERRRDAWTMAWRAPDPERDTEAERDTLRVYWETTAALLGAEDREALMTIALEGAIRLCGARGGIVGLYDEGGQLEVVAARGPGGPESRPDSDPDDVTRARSRRAPVARRSSHPGRPWSVVVPMTARGRDRGLMSLEANRGRDLKDVLLAETVANLAVSLLDALPPARVLH